MSLNIFNKNRLRYWLHRLTTTMMDQTILFEAENGTEYSGRVRALYETLRKDQRYYNFYFVWSFVTPEDHRELLDNRHTMLVRRGTAEYIKCYIRAAFCLSDTPMPRYLKPSKSQVHALLQSDPASEALIDSLCETPAHHPSHYEHFILFIKKMLNRGRLLYLMGWYNCLGFFRSRGMLHNNNSLRLERLKDLHAGERCFLIGNGPSLTGEDLNLLQEEYTFGTNMVYKIFDTTEWRPSFHCISDTIYASKLGLELSQKVKAPLFTTERTYRKMKVKPINTTYVHTLQSERYRVRGNIQAYCMVKATVLSLAAEIAFHMGFREIYLIGVDCTNPHTKGGHFTENYTTKEVAETDINRIKTRMKKKSLTTEQIGEHIIDRSMEVYSLLDEYAQKNGIKIYNATRGGNLEIFPRVRLEDVLAGR